MAALLILAAVVAAAAPPQSTRADRPVASLAADLRAALPEVRARAACDLREHGDDGVTAAAALADLLADAAPVDGAVCGRRWWRGADPHVTSPGELAAAALVAQGSRSTPVLLSGLQSSAWTARRNAAWALGALRDTRAIAPLLDALKDAEPLVREQAAWALGAIRADPALDALLGALKDPHPGVRRQAAWAIGVIGK